MINIKNKKNSKFIYETTDFSKISDDETTFNNVLKNKSFNENEELDEDLLNSNEENDLYNKNEGDVYSEDYLNTDMIEDIDLNSILNKKKNAPQKKYNEQISNEIKLDVVCDKPNYATDTCMDICNDTYYYLRRLQRFDTRLFKFKATGKYKSLYSKKCQSSQERQPIVLESDPEKNPKIKRDSYTYAIKYGSDANHQYYYICPKVWCPTCKIPIKFEDLKKFEQRRGKKDLM